MLPLSDAPARVWWNWSALRHSHKTLTISSCPVMGGCQGWLVHENMPPMAPVGAPVELLVARIHASAKQVVLN